MVKKNEKGKYSLNGLIIDVVVYFACNYVQTTLKCPLKNLRNLLVD